MEPYRLERGEDGRAFSRVPYREHALLNHPMFNKSTAFTREERRRFGLDGLRPDAVSTLEQQAVRAYGNIVRKTDPRERFIGLAALFSSPTTGDPCLECAQPCPRGAIAAGLALPWMDFEIVEQD